MNTKDKGNIAEAKVLAALVALDTQVLLPWGDNLRYDMAYYEGGQFTRIQCKTGRLRDGAICFNASSSQAHRGNGQQDYRGQADLFGVYCPDNDKVYLVPVDVCGTSKVHLRVDPSKNGQSSKVRPASEYEVFVR